MKFSEKLDKLITSKKFTTVLSFIGLYLLATGISLGIFSYLSKRRSSFGEIQDLRSKIASLPKTEECPINGKMFTKIEEDIWSKRRPVTAVVENHIDSRPPSGVSKADVIYEAVAEGGITRFLGVFYCGVAEGDIRIAPVRSARVYFINWAAEYGENPIFMHVGGANDFSGFGDTTLEAQALELLEKMGWRTPRGNDFDTTYDSGFPVFWRNYERLEKEVATEHTMMASLDAAYKQAEKRGFDEKEGGKLWSKGFDVWKFDDDNPSSNPDADSISFKFWDDKPDYHVKWEYDKENNQYLRYTAGKKHEDLLTGDQLSAKNVVTLFVKEKGPVDNNYHMLYTTIGEGKALVFQNGEVIEATWEKESAKSRTLLYDSKGKEISFVRGIIWFEAVPAGNDIDY